MRDSQELASRLNETREEIAEIRAEHIESYTAAYMSITNLDPREAVLVEEHIDNRIIWYFAAKKDVLDA